MTMMAISTGMYATQNVKADQVSVEAQNTQQVALAKAGMVAALYVAFTLINPLSFGAVQLRFSELFNNLSVFNKRYIWAVKKL